MLFLSASTCLHLYHAGSHDHTIPASVSHLSDSVGQDVDNFFMGGGHHALAVDLDDAVAHSDPTSLGDAPTHQAADLRREDIQVRPEFTSTAPHVPAGGD